MSHPFHHTYRWQQMRLYQLREEPLCRMCLDLFQRETVAVVADHVTPHRGDEDLFWNGPLQSLCKDCHDSLKQQIEKGGRIRGSRLDGSPIDPRHPWNRT